MNAICEAAPVLELPNVRICLGLGDGSSCACWMGMVTMATSEEFSDRPKTVADTIRNYCIRLNDSMGDDATREKYIKPIWNLPINTAVRGEDGVYREDPGHAQERVMIALRYAFHKILPGVFTAIGFESQAKALEVVKLDNWEDRSGAAVVARKVRDELYAIRSSRAAADAAASAADAAYAADADSDAYAAADAAAYAAARALRLASPPAGSGSVVGVGGGVGGGGNNDEVVKLQSARERVWELATECVREMCNVGRAA